MIGEQKNKNRKVMELTAFVDRDPGGILLNERVQQEAVNLPDPLLEWENCVSLASSNMDEFFEVQYYWSIEKEKEKNRLLLKKINQLLSSTNWMEHDLSKRIEQMFSVKDDRCRKNDTYRLRSLQYKQ